MNLTFDLIGIVVADMAKSLAFYRLLGLEISPEADTERHVETTVNGIRIAWDTEALIETFDTDRSFVNGHSRVGLAFRCETPATVDTAYENIVMAGYTGHKPPWDAFWGQRYAVVTDPDGNHIDLFADLPTS